MLDIFLLDRLLIFPPGWTDFCPLKLSASLHGCLSAGEGDGDLGRKMLSLLLSEQFPPDRNNRPEGPFFPQPAGKLRMPWEPRKSRFSPLGPALAPPWVKQPS